MLKQLFFCFVLQHSTQAHLQMNALKSTAEKLSHMFGTERSLPICQEEKNSVLLCYKQNPEESLNCSDAVKNFSRCVHSTRMVRFTSIYQ